MAIKILSSENITGNITLHSPTNAPYIDFVENADTSDSKAKITMDQVDTNNGTLLFATENAGTLFNQVKITQTGNLLLSDDAASFNTSNAKLNVLPASSGVYQQWNYSPSNENFSLKLKETVTSGNVRYVFEQINNSTTYPNILVFNSGKVGIGTDSPDSKLDVKGASATPADGNQTLSITNTTGGTQLNLGSAENSYGWIEAREGATLRNLLLNPNGGNIGIGTTTPIAPLHVVTPAVGGIDLTNISRTTNNLVRFTNPEYSTSATMGLLLRVFPDSDARQGAGLLMTGGSDNAASNLTLFVSKDDGTSSNVSQSYSALHIAGNTGNVGVGTTSPTQKLDTPNIVIGGSSIAANYRANSTMMDNLGGIARFYSLGADTSTAGSYQFNSLSSNATAGPGTVMTILNNGNVGIGDTAPTSISINTSSLSVNSSRNDLSGGLISKANGTVKHQQYWDSSGYSFNLTASSGVFKFNGADVQVNANIKANDVDGKFYSMVASWSYVASKNDLFSYPGTDGAVWEYTIKMNPNTAGSGSYRDFYYGKLGVGMGWNGSNVTQYIWQQQDQTAPRTLYDSGGGNFNPLFRMYYSGGIYTELAYGTAWTLRIQGLSTTTYGDVFFRRLA